MSKKPRPKPKPYKNFIAGYVKVHPALMRDIGDMEREQLEKKIKEPFVGPEGEICFASIESANRLITAIRK